MNYHFDFKYGYLCKWMGSEGNFWQAGYQQGYRVQIVGCYVAVDKMLVGLQLENGIAK